MLWGGLKPIRSRLYLDLITLCLSGYAIITSSNNKPLFYTDVLLTSACLIIFTSSGLTKRWTISFPVILMVILHIIRKLILELLQPAGVDENHHALSGVVSLIISGISILLLIMSAALSILFPAVEISHPKGKYNIGVIDVHLPVKFDNEAGHDTTTKNDFVSVRLMYPTNDHVESVPSFNKDTATEICRALMEVGAPPPLNKLTWMLDTWQLSRIKAKRDAQPLNDIGKMPMVVFSHGLTGNSALYSYQAINLASKGNLVAVVEHSDGSAIGMKKQDGSFLRYDSSISEIEKECNVTYVRTRRKQTNHRATELHVVTLALMQLNKRSYYELETKGISFINKLDIFNIAVGGHSFGGATAVTAAARNPELYNCVIAHDPALDWVPDDARKALFEDIRFKDSSVKYQGGTGGYESDDCHNNNIMNEEQQEQNGTAKGKKMSIHDIDLLFLYSHEWKQKGWGGSPYIFDMQKRGQLGPKKYNLSECLYIHHSNHSEFSDSCMKTPLWLGRATGMTGVRNPHETAKEIADRTSDFLQNVLNKQRAKEKIA